MKPKQWAQIRELFATARKLPKEKRVSFIESNTTDSIVLEQVQKLLDNDQEDTFLNTPALGNDFSLSDSQSPKKGMTLPEDLIEGYSISKILGSGASGIVYEAKQHEPKRTVAIKVLRAGAMGTDEQARFRREAETLATLEHVNIATVFATGTTKDGSPWMSIEYVNGSRLDHWAVNATVREIASIMKKIGDAVQQAHLHYIIHRDLKPANILVTKEGEPRVLDFGVARITRENNSTIVTHTGAVIGTQKYMSPEQECGSANVDQRSDVYALGILLLELLQSKAPNDLWIIAKKASDEFPDRRYADAGEFSNDLQQWLTNKPIKAKRATLLYSSSLWIKRHKVVSALLCLILISSVVTYYQFEARKWLQYASLIQRAQLSFEDGDLAQMADALEQCEPSHRAWEWHWLNQLSNTGTIPFDTLSVASDNSGVIVATLKNGDVIEAIRNHVIFTIPFNPVKTLISEDCSTVVAVQQGGDISIYSTYDNTIAPRSLSNHLDGNNISAMAISDDGRYLIIATSPMIDPLVPSTIDATSRVVGIDLANDTLLFEDVLSGRVLDTNSALAVATNGTTIASLINGGVAIWRFGEIIDQREIKVYKSPSTVAINSDGTMVAIAELNSGTSSILFLDIETLEQTKDTPTIAHDRGIISVDFSPNADKVASIDGGGVLRITPLNGEPPVVELMQEREESASARFSDDSSRLLIRNHDGITRVRSASSHIHEFQVWTEQLPIEKAYMSYGKVLAYHVNARSMYDFKKATVTFMDESLELFVSPSKTPDGSRTALVIDGGTIRIVESWSGTPLLSFTWPGAHIVGAGFIQEGRVLIAISLDGRIRTWNAFE